MTKGPEPKNDQNGNQQSGKKLGVQFAGKRVRERVAARHLNQNGQTRTSILSSTTSKDVFTPDSAVISAR